jgi:hypothetical protein
MAGHNLKSPSITNLDSTPVIANTIGEGAPGFLMVINDTTSPVSADDTTSTYRLCRFPTNAKVKALWIYSTLLAAGAGDIDVAFSDSLTDGTSSAFNTLANPAVLITAGADNKLFGAAVALFVATTAVPPTEFTFRGTFTPAMQNIPMWQNLVTLGATQFTSDPGGFFDIYVKITTTITTGGFLAAKLEYVE